MTEHFTSSVENTTINSEIIDTFFDSPEKLGKSDFICAVINGWLSVGESQPLILPEIIHEDAMHRDEGDAEDSPQRKILRDILNKAPFLEAYQQLVDDPSSAEMLEFMQKNKHDESYTTLRKATMSLIELWAEQLKQGGDTKSIRDVFDKMINP